MKKTTAPKIQFRSNVRLTSAPASEIASRSAFIANMRTTESSETTGADATQDNTGTLRTMELEDEDSVGSICPLDDVANHEHRMNQQEFNSENIDAELDDNNDGDIIDTSSGIMAVFLKAVHRQLREEVNGRVTKEQWLLTILKAPGADWWIRAGQARVVCKKLGLMYGEPSYYRGGEGSISLEFMICNRITKCRCLLPKPTS